MGWQKATEEVTGYERLSDAEVGGNETLTCFSSGKLSLHSGTDIDICLREH